MHCWGKRNKRNITTYLTFESYEIRWLLFSTWFWEFLFLLLYISSLTLKTFLFCFMCASSCWCGCVDLCRSAHSRCVWSTACSSAIVPEIRRRRNATCAASSPVTYTKMSTAAEECVYTPSTHQHVARLPHSSQFSIRQVQSFHHKPNWHGPWSHQQMFMISADKWSWIRIDYKLLFFCVWQINQTRVPAPPRPCFPTTFRKSCCRWSAVPRAHRTKGTAISSTCVVCSMRTGPSPGWKTHSSIWTTLKTSESGWRWNLAALKQLLWRGCRNGSNKHLMRM